MRCSPELHATFPLTALALPIAPPAPASPPAPSWPRQLPPDELELRESLGRIRRDGYGITFAHRTLNTVGIAAPFFDGGGEVVGSVGFLIPEYRWTSSPQTAVVKALLNAAARLSRQLGHIDSGEVAPPISFMSKNGQA
jgi:hypothetical protein